MAEYGESRQAGEEAREAAHHRQGSEAITSCLQTRVPRKLFTMRWSVSFSVECDKDMGGPQHVQSQRKVRRT